MEEIYLLYVSNTYLYLLYLYLYIPYEFWVCLGTFVFVGSGHVVSMFLIVIKLIILITLVAKLFIF
jgi:hypothetical protein